ncbi:MAG: galactose mutarotase [Bacilli bacterium]|nr:galactose mutarotase [Bacilli bacterium]
MKKQRKAFLLVAISFLLGACTNTAPEKKSELSSLAGESSNPISSVVPSSADTRELITDQLYTDNGLKVYFNAKGARIDKITWQNRQIAKDGFTVGRCANRIAQGKFTLNGTDYSVTVNNNGNSLHGGSRQWNGPFANANWTKVEQTPASITYSLHSADGEEGYPGNMDMTVKYTLSPEGELGIEYTATSDADTLCNPTNHLYISANGNTSYDNLNLWINADKYTPLDAKQLPTGEVADVAGTKYDYSTKRAFSGSDEYDDNYVLKGKGFRHVATLTSASNYLSISVATDRPGLQLYKAGQGQICLETQMLPDAINHPEFDEYGTTILKAGETFNSKTSYSFLAID